MPKKHTQNCTLTNFKVAPKIFVFLGKKRINFFLSPGRRIFSFSFDNKNFRKVSRNKKMARLLTLLEKAKKFGLIKIL